MKPIAGKPNITQHITNIMQPITKIMHPITKSHNVSLKSRNLTNHESNTFCIRFGVLFSGPSALVPGSPREREIEHISLRHHWARRRSWGYGKGHAECTGPSGLGPERGRN